MLRFNHVAIFWIKWDHEVSKVTLCVKILNGHSLAKGRSRAARSAKNNDSGLAEQDV